MPSDHLGTRVAENESIFRELNEHLGATARGGAADPAAFVCECAHISCSELLAVPLAEYERVRQNSTWFLVAADAKAATAALAFVDDYKSNVMANLTPETNAVVRALGGFARIWKTGAAWNTGTPLRPEILRANMRYCARVTKARTQAEAKALATKVMREHAAMLAAHEAQIDQTVMGNMGSFYRVLIGPFASAQETQGVCAKLKGAGLDCLVTAQ